MNDDCFTNPCGQGQTCKDLGVRDFTCQCGSDYRFDPTKKTCTPLSTDAAEGSAQLSITFDIDEKMILSSDVTTQTRYISDFTKVVSEALAIDQDRVKVLGLVRLSTMQFM